MPGKTRRVDALRILEPSAEAEYVLTFESRGDRIRLQSSVDGAQPLFWYLDERYVGRSEPQEPLYVDLRPGTHQVSCMNAEGAVDRVSFKVVTPGQSV